MLEYFTLYTIWDCRDGTYIKLFRFLSKLHKVNTASGCNRYILVYFCLYRLEMQTCIPTKFYNRLCTIFRTYRYIAYRRFARWIYKVLPKKERRIHPACVVTAIRKRFPSEQYTGFKYPELLP